MGQIYGIKNLLNNKIVYIGQTINSYQKRWQQHKIQSKERKYALYLAFNKYGIENFEPFLIEECNNQELNDRERFWINYYKTYIDDNGYNMTRGGDSCSDRLKKPVYQYDFQGNFINGFESASEAARILNKDYSTINRAANEIVHSAHGFLWSYEKVNKLNLDNKNLRTTHTRPIYQYDKNKRFLNEYSSVSKAAEAIGKTPANISKCALGQRKTAYGYIWSYSKI